MSEIICHRSVKSVESVKSIKSGPPLRIDLDYGKVKVNITLTILQKPTFGVYLH